MQNEFFSSRRCKTVKKTFHTASKNTQTIIHDENITTLQTNKSGNLIIALTHVTPSQIWRV